MRSTDELVEEAGRLLQARFGDAAFSATDFEREMEKRGKKGVQASDYCYNLINKDPKSLKHPVFAWVRRGQYKYLGSSFPYTGPISWNGRNVGEWKSGECELHEDPRISGPRG